MKWFDQWIDASAEKTTRGIAQRTSRRGFLGKLAGVIAGGAATVPLLPVARAQDNPAPQEAGDPAGCDYWRYCAIDGFLCGCCGGSMNSCPPGTEMSPITWIGTCTNPVDNRNYIISYNDCCGKHFCGRCFCNRNEGERPAYHWYRNNDINWCAGTKTQVYNCSTALVVGLAVEAQPEK